VSFCAALSTETVDLDAFTHTQIVAPVSQLSTNSYSYVHVNRPNKLFLFCKEFCGFGMFELDHALLFSTTFGLL